MSAPHFYAYFYLMYGAIIAFGGPAAAWYYYGPLAAIGSVVAIIHVGFGLAMVLSEGDEGAGTERSTSLGPSFLAGLSILFVVMTVVPLTVTPAAIWMWLLPVDVHGYVGLSNSFSLDIDEFRGPHHAGGE